MLLPGLAQASPLQLAQSVSASFTAPATASVREMVPMLPRAPQPATDPEAISLIVRWEVSGESGYVRKWSGVYYPGGASGPTWGIGYDGGHQTMSRIRADWREHPEVRRLAQAAGISGGDAKAQITRWGDINTPYAAAYAVFSEVSLPDYRAQARRAFGPPFDALPPRAAGALVSLIYNRGPGMTGNARREMRVIRDECLPTADTACIARALRAMCRIWVGTPNGEGLCRRRKSEAELATLHLRDDDHARDQ